MGRQVFAHANPRAMAKALVMMVHDGASAKEAPEAVACELVDHGNLVSQTVESSTPPDGVDRSLFRDGNEHLRIDGEILRQGEQVLGAYLRIREGDTQTVGVAHLGTVEWIVVECETWSMIPLENLIAHRTGTHTKIAAVIRTPLEAQGAGFALEEGVDALVVDDDEAMIQAAMSVKAQRLERSVEATDVPDQLDVQHSLTTFTVESVEEAGVGDRYCLDFLSLFSVGEGLLVGSSADAMFLVHSETVPSTFVPTRPFRVNAGSPHAYVMMADGNTRYMAELTAGDELLAVDQEGNGRSVVLGRLKIEQRPMLKIVGKNHTKTHQNANTCHVFMQQAETVRLITGDSHGCSGHRTPEGSTRAGLGRSCRPARRSTGEGGR